MAREQRNSGQPNSGHVGQFVANVVASFTIGIALLALLLPGQADAHHDRTNNPLVGWGTADPWPSAWSYYDRKATTTGANLDWPAMFFFYNNADQRSIITVLQTAGYGASGGDKYMSAINTSGQYVWEADPGRKVRVDTVCPGLWGEHMRVYGPTNGAYRHSFYHPGYGYMAIGTVHLDLDDAPWCAGPRYGYADVAENWFIGPLNVVAPNFNWQIAYQAQSHWANSTPDHSIPVGNEITYYGNNALQTNVWIG